MPLFGSTFSPKKTPPRKAASLSNLHLVKLGSFTGDRREMQRLRKRNQQLEEENNLLRLKVDILLDMLSETTAESHLMEKELEELKSHIRRRK
ncbi:UNVERIFIED_CONTAM: hypothetical protein H355_015816 [Colinus virginianus]|nr:hypothetical protein H355_015816 [Colinus virginianus]